MCINEALRRANGGYVRSRMWLQNPHGLAYEQGVRPSGACSTLMEDRDGGLWPMYFSASLARKDWEVIE
jgi:hypothetical protein